MREVAENLSAIVAHTEMQLDMLRDDETSAPLKPGGWSRKQVLGHLIDSASNNHQRFVRLLLSDDVTFPSYQQDAWVAAQAYGARPWAELVALWVAYNGHLAHLMEQAPAAALKHVCRVGEDAPVTLEFLMRDYVRHLQHHLRSF